MGAIMRIFGRCVVWGLVVCTLAACSKDSPEGPQPEQITGTWNATKVEYVQSGASTVVDLIADSATATLVIGADNSFEYTLTPKGAAPEVTTGTWTLSGDVWKATPAGMGWSWEWNVALAAGTLSLTGANAEYDFDHDGTPEAATWNMAFTR